MTTKLCEGTWNAPDGVRKCQTGVPVPAVRVTFGRALCQGCYDQLFNGVAASALRVIAGGKS